jgi:hypothetical protein
LSNRFIFLAATYLTSLPVKEDDKVFIGFRGSYDTYMEVASTSRELAKIVNIKGDKVKRDMAANIEFAFTTNVNKKTISFCEDYINAGDKALFGHRGIYDQCLWDMMPVAPVTRYSKLLLAAATVLSFKDMTSEANIAKAKEILSSKLGFPKIIFNLFTFYRIELEDTYMDIDEKSLEKLCEVMGKTVFQEYPKHLSLGDEDISDAEYEVLDEYINKTAYTSAMAMMIKADTKNLMEAFLSANPPIDDYIDEMIEYANRLKATDYVEMLKAAKK